ncbi:MAG: radical SAM protein [Patescibacteria group bacterium]|nr:radical SAM protein [Patescibacteria group bacterium]
MEGAMGYDPVAVAEALRPRMIDLANKKVLLAVLAGTKQQQDLTANRFWADVFRSKIYTKAEDLKLNPFRREPAGVAAEKLTIAGETMVTPEKCNAAFLGQINGCNLDCWYCYVDRVANSANHEFGRFFSAEEYLTQFLIESRRNQNASNPDLCLNILRISGGEVFIVPEIIVWMVEAIEKFKLEKYIYVWVDCNLTTGDFYWKYLTAEQREKIKNFKNLGVCGCHKGFDETTFQENTGADPQFFNRQIEMHRRLIDEGLDVYSYLYPMTTSTEQLREKLAAFIDRLRQEVDELAPLKMATPPIKVYGPTATRLTPARKAALENQHVAMQIWKEELQKRYPAEQLALQPHQIPAKTR